MPLDLAPTVLRGFYALNIMGAGRSGLHLLRGSAKEVDAAFGAPAVTPPMAATVIGSSWVGLALVSALGLFAPKTYRQVEHMK